jgi:hypothetical protein
MSTKQTPAPRTRRHRTLAALAASTAAIVTFGAVALAAAAPAEDEAPQVEPVVYSSEFLYSVAEYAEARGMSGLSPASLSVPVEIAPSAPVGCHGLSPASATGCTAEEIERALR